MRNEREESKTSRRLRLGAVSFLNSRPLVHGIERSLRAENDPTAPRDGLARAGGVRFSLEYDLPSRCAARLAAGEFDLALIPSIEYARTRGYAAVPGICIASRGAAASVLLFSRKPPGEIRSVGVDSASRSSVALLRILMRERWGNDPAFVEEPADLVGALTRHDAALVIGDRALFARPEDVAGTIVTDLGLEWKGLTGLPFVFAFWAGREGVVREEHLLSLHGSLDHGLAHLEEIAFGALWEGAPRPEKALRYLRENIWYRWGQPERDGLLRFYLLAGRHGLIDEVPEMTFFGERVAGGMIRA